MAQVRIYQNKGRFYCCSSATGAAIAASRLASLCYTESRSVLLMSEAAWGGAGWGCMAGGGSWAGGRLGRCERLWFIQAIACSALCCAARASRTLSLCIALLLLALCDSSCSRCACSLARAVDAILSITSKLCIRDFSLSSAWVVVVTVVG
jgi:hypothetical protein